MVCFTAPILHGNRISHLLEQLIEFQIKIGLQLYFNCLCDAKPPKLAKGSIISNQSLTDVGAVQTIYTISAYDASLYL